MVGFNGVYRCLGIVHTVFVVALPPKQVLLKDLRELSPETPT